LLAIVLVLFVLLTLRTVQLQALEPDRYVALGRDQTNRTQILAADRGTIFDRNGFELAISRPVKTVYTDPKLVDDPADAAATLAPVLDKDAADLEDALGASNRFGYLARHVTDEVAQQVEELEVPGVYTLEEPKRFVPAGETAHSLVGRTDIDNIGIGGLERQYEDVLAGTPGELMVERDPAGRTIPLGEHHLTPAEKGDDLVLTIDRALQFEAERLLRDRVNAQGAKGGVIVVADPTTGELLTMANIDTDSETGEARVSSNNLALTTVYEPGSVMKLITMSFGLEHDVVSPETCVPAPDSLQVADKVFTEYKPHGGGCWLPEDVISRSSNTASINIGLRLGKERLYEGFKAFGLGDLTGLEFPNEQAGFVRPLDEWWTTSIGSMAIGQGISVTPTQMLFAFNAIANDGWYVPPKLVHSSIDSKGVEHLTPTREARQVVSAETADQITEMLCKVVETGTAKAAQVEGYTACGKTGTALKPYGGGYTGPDGVSHYMSTFIGFLPRGDAQLAALVLIDDPGGAEYTGGAVAAPVFAELAQFAVRHFEIAPGVETAGEPTTTGSPPASPSTTGGPTQALPAVVPEDPSVGQD
jgi:cell division protein FtsI (penicillin-binding protein 3)